MYIHCIYAHRDNNSGSFINFSSNNITNSAATIDSYSLYLGNGASGTTNFNSYMGIQINPILGINFNNDNTAVSTPYSGITNNLMGANISPSVRSGTALVATGLSAGAYTSGTGIIREARGLSIGLTLAGGSDSQPHNPYGIYISNSITASGGTANNAYSIYSLSTQPSYFVGNIGIGTATPTARLHLMNTVEASLKSLLPNSSVYNLGATNTVGRITSGIEMSWYSESWKLGATRGVNGDIESLVIARNDVEAMVIDANRNVGIGTNTPKEKLEVAGAIKIGTTSAASPTAGTIRFNSTTSKFEGYDGIAWVAFH